MELTCRSGHACFAICRLSTSNRLAILGSAPTMHANIRVHIFQKELE